MGNTQIGIRTTEENKEFFNQLEGKNQHEKFELLRKIYYESIAKENTEFNVNNYITDAENVFNNFIHIIKGLESSVMQYKKRIYEEYVVNIGKNIKEIEDVLKEKDENVKKVKALMGEIERLQRATDESHFQAMTAIVENDKLKDQNKDLIKTLNAMTIKNKQLEEEKEKITAQIDGNNKIYDGFVKDLQDEIAKLNSKNFNLIKTNDELMREKTNLLIENNDLKEKIISQKKLRNKKYFK